MNYTNNVNCHQMKPLERKFFKYVCKHIDYEKVNIEYSQHVSFIRPISVLADEFSDKYGIPIKMIKYWLKKWSDYGFYNYGVGIYFGWFEFVDALILDIPMKNRWGRDVNKKFRQYIDIVPSRVRHKYRRAKNNDRERGMRKQ